MAVNKNNLYLNNIILYLSISNYSKWVFLHIHTVFITLIYFYSVQYIWLLSCSCTTFFFPPWATSVFLFPDLQEISGLSDYLFIWTTVIIQSVLFLGEQHLIHVSCRGLAAAPGWGSPVPLLSATDPQWFHLYLLCLTVNRLLLLLWNDAWIMLGHLEANKTQHLDDHCFTATNHRIKEWFRQKGVSRSHLVQYALIGAVQTAQDFIQLDQNSTDSEQSVPVSVTLNHKTFFPIFI